MKRLLTPFLVFALSLVIIGTKTPASAQQGMGTNITLVASNGSAAAPSIAFVASSSFGFYSASATSIGLGTGTASQDSHQFTSAGNINTISGGVRGFSSSATDATVAADTGISRDSAGVIDIGTGAAASKAGSLNLTNLTPTGTFTQGSSGQFALNASGLLTKSNNIALAGQGLTEIVGITSQKTESAADANVLTVTPASAVGSYRINFTLSVSAATAATLGFTATWTDSNGNAQTPTNLACEQTGVAAPFLTAVFAAAGNMYCTALIDVNNAGTAIVVKLTFAGTSFTAKASASVERII